LVGYDQKRRGWRLFALDAIVGLPAKAGTVYPLRPIPEAYENGDVLGFIKGTVRTVDVTVEFSAKVAASATSRFWKSDQQVKKLPGGTALVTVSVSDLDEVVRWAFGFGADARVVSPPAAVLAARDLAEELLRLHE
jgi:predicted DNA-binding transcriptional regulator YafY